MASVAHCVCAKYKMCHICTMLACVSAHTVHCIAGDLDMCVLLLFNLLSNSMEILINSLIVLRDYSSEKFRDDLFLQHRIVVDIIWHI